MEEKNCRFHLQSTESATVLSFSRYCNSERKGIFWQGSAARLKEMFE